MIDEELTLFSNIKMTGNSSKSNSVFGGFHLYNPPTKKYESDEMIDNVIDSLQKKGSIYYTCHCTGKWQFEQLKKVMGSQLEYLHCGEAIEI